MVRTRELGGVGRVQIMALRRREGLIGLGTDMRLLHVPPPRLISISFLRGGQEQSPRRTAWRACGPEMGVGVKRAAAANGARRCLRWTRQPLVGVVRTQSIGRPHRLQAARNHRSVQTAPPRQRIQPRARPRRTPAAPREPRAAPVAGTAGESRPWAHRRCDSPGRDITPAPSWGMLLRGPYVGGALLTLLGTTTALCLQDAANLFRNRAGQPRCQWHHDTWGPPRGYMS
jgi:hypothetical protein